MRVHEVPRGQHSSAVELISRPDCVLLEWSRNRPSCIHTRLDSRTTGAGESACICIYTHTHALNRHMRDAALFTTAHIGQLVKITTSKKP